MKESKPKAVYIIAEYKTGFYKIGFSEDVHHRLKTLQSGNPRRLSIVLYMIVTDSAAVERKAHTVLRKYHVLNEWFKLDKATLQVIKDWLLQQG